MAERALGRSTSISSAHSAASTKRSMWPSLTRAKPSVIAALPDLPALDELSCPMRMGATRRSWWARISIWPSWVTKVMDSALPL